jgi:predicted dehydrogenase
MISRNNKIAIIGAGYMAEEYLKVLSKKKIWCEAIYSTTLSKCERLKKKYKIRKIYQDFDELKNVQNLIIAINDVSTLQTLKRLNLSKYKILCEKPVGVSFNETKKISLMIKKNKSNFFVGLNRRFYSSTINVTQLIKQNSGKRIIHIQDQQMQNTKNSFVNKNVMYCNSVHLIDYIMIFARGKLTKLNKIKNFKNKKFSEHTTKLIFSSKDEVLYNCNWNSPGAWSVNIIQNNQRCELNPLEDLMFEKFENKKRKRLSFKRLKIDKDFKPGIYNQVGEFLKMLKNKKNKLVKFEEYFETVKLIKKIYA